MLFKRTLFGEKVRTWLPFRWISHTHRWRMLLNVNKYGNLYFYCKICGETKQRKVCKINTIMSIGTEW